MAHLDKVLIWERPDGKNSITHLDSDDMLPGETEDDFVIRWTARVKGSASHLKDITPAKIERKNLPSIDTDQHSWVVKGEKVEVDAVKAQAILNAKNQKEAEKSAILSKLGITKEELGKVIG